MQQTNKTDTTILDNMIVGRVEPYIYAFSTETVPNYLKVGDTYRPLEKRLKEWQNHYPNLIKQFADVAKVDEETFFRDYSVHHYLENSKQKTRLTNSDLYEIDPTIYYSNEFFYDTEVQDVKDAIVDINESHTKNDGKYQFYKFDESRIPIIHTYPRNETFERRPNQKETINNFKKAIENGRTSLLMYAVMRFGKSFTSMYCATEMSAKVVVIVSAKADVKKEWKKTVESHTRFEGYKFFDSNDLARDYSIIQKTLDENNKVVVFLTLQDLQGDEIKTRHEKLFKKGIIDLLIIDETHFGARGEKYGKVLQELNIGKPKKGTDPQEKDTYYLDDLAKSVKVLEPKVRIHLSGTPYRILMGDEFKPEDIIAFCQFSDIADAQNKWDKEHLDNEDVNEWDNPYYGFPQMVRFAFHPNASARKKLEELKKDGITYAFSALFRPKSIKKDKKHQGHKFFYHEQEILDLLEIIDGSKSEEGMFGFLDYDKIKEGKMCRHIVCVLPFRASCDALEKLITDNKDKFKNLNQYEIINITGVDNNLYKDAEAVKTKIKECEKKNKKTLTLTVNRMLTGSTVEEWDTMIYFKDTASPQEYDQAIFRLQNQYVRTLKDDKGKDIIKRNMKPQTLLVDFDPNRMFVMQEQKSQIYNVNTDKHGNTKLVERIIKELEISPIITINANKIEQVVPAKILDAVREYSKNKSVVDEATAIPVDFSLLNIDIIRKEIEKQGILGTKQGLKIAPTEDEGTDIDVPENNKEEETTSTSTTTSSKKDTPEDDLKKKFATYYSRILFFAFLTKDEILSLEGLISAIEASDDNKRIGKNLDLDINILQQIQEKMNPFILRDLDYKIENLNTLANDENIKPEDRPKVAMKKFERLSSSEVVTPEKVADEMVAILPKDEIRNTTKILDIASKSGEFVYAVYKAYGKAVADNFYSIPTSKAAYEFTRKVYELLGLDISHIESEHDSYYLIDKKTTMIKDNKIMINKQEMDFDIIVGNPPFDKKDGGAGASSTPLYDDFVSLSKRIHPLYVSMIMPAKWYTDGKGLVKFRESMLSDTHISKLVDFTDSRDCFDNVDVPGGVCYFLWSEKYSGKCEFTSRHQGNSKSTIRDLSEQKNFIRHIEAIEIINKVRSISKNYYNEKVSSRKPFGLATNVKPLEDGDITLKYNNGKGPYKSSFIKVGREMIMQWKVIISYLTAEHAGQTDKSGRKKMLSSLDMLAPNEICSETYLVVDTFDTKEEAENLYSYLRTCFVRFLIAQLAATQHMTKEKFSYVPLQDFTANSDIDWSKPVADIDKQLYKKYGLSEEEVQFIEQMIKPM